MSTLHSQARALAEAGYRVFPCQPDGKAPACEHGWKDATTDLAQIDRWWTENDQYNLAIVPDVQELAVIDIDPGGDEVWAALLNKHGEHAPTYTNLTPREGRHIYFTGRVPATQGRLGLHIDTRGAGYVLVPPSVVNGKPYRVLYDVEPAPLPAWISEALEATPQAVTAAVEVEPDLPGAIARARNMLAARVTAGKIAIEGAHGEWRTLNLFHELRDMGLGIDKAIELVREPGGWNEKCQPPWDEDEMRAKAQNAYKYAQNSPGAWAVRELNDAFSNAMKPQAPARSRFAMWTEQDDDNEPEETWIVPGLIPEDATVLWIGPPSQFKSFLLLDVLLALASGRETFGITPIRGGPCIYGAAEDRRSIGGKRRRAWKFARGVSDPIPDFVSCNMPYLGITADFEELCTQVETWLAGRKLKLFAIDTASQVVGGMNENESAVVREFYSMCRALRERFGCAVVAIHHTGKDGDRGPRGSGAWVNDCDSMISIKRPNEDTLDVEVRAVRHKNESTGQRWTFKGQKFAGSLAFSLSTPDQYQEAVDDKDIFAPAKIGRALSSKNAVSRRTALSTADLLAIVSPGDFGSELANRRLEKLGKTTLRGYCEVNDGVIDWWFTPKQETGDEKTS